MAGVHSQPTSNAYQVSDAVCIRVDGTDDTCSFQYGVVIGASGASGASGTSAGGTSATGAEVQCQYLEKKADGTYEIGSDVYDVPLACIVRHGVIGDDHDEAPTAWDTMGFRMLDGGSFVKHSDEVGNRLFPVGDVAFEVASSSSDSAGSLRDFIVPDEESDPFTRADPAIEYVRETHEAVRAFKNWY